MLGASTTVDSEKLAFTYDGTSWSSPVVIDSSFTTEIYAVSCASSTFCVAVSSAGEAITYNGSTWSAPFCA